MSANFDPLARVYRYLEYAMFGPALWRRRVAYLERLRASSRVLMVGEGDGRFLAAFLRANSRARVDYFDASAKMLGLARERAGADAGRVRFFQADLLAISQFPTTYDAVITHFFLDCFSEEELARFVPWIGQAVEPNGCWVVSEFQDKPMGAGLLLRGLYLFFGVATGLRRRQLPDYHRVLSAAGFGMVEAEKSLAGLLTSEIWERGKLSACSEERF